MLSFQYEKLLVKFDSKVHECVFMKYSSYSSVYKVYNKQTKLLEQSLYIKFDETNILLFPLTSATEGHSVTTNKTRYFRNDEEGKGHGFQIPLHNKNGILPIFENFHNYLRKLKKKSYMYYPTINLALHKLTNISLERNNFYVEEIISHVETKFNTYLKWVGCVHFSFVLYFVSIMNPRVKWIGCVYLITTFPCKYDL